MTERVQGLNDLLKMLDELTLVQGKRVLANALKNGAQILAHEEEHRAPVGKTGRLARSIRVRLVERSATHAVVRIGPSRRAFWASFKEWGTRFKSATPFVGPSYDAKISEVLSVIAYDLKRFIDKAIKKNSG